MTPISIEEAQAKLAELIRRLGPGEEVVVTENNRPVARIVSTAATETRPARKLGTLQGTVLQMSPDFDAPLAEFGEYMQ
jgi:prevent-host-death family protein